MLARLPKPIVIAMAVLAACYVLPIVWVALLRFLIGDGSELGLLLRFGLLVAGAVGLKRLVASWKEDPPSLEPLRETGVAVVKAVPPLVRAISSGTRQLFDVLKRIVIYLRECRWPRASNWFVLTFGIFILQAIPLTGIFILFLGAPLWPIITVNLGFAHLVIEPAMRDISPRWSLVGLAWFVGYAAMSIHGHIALDRLSAEVATENSRQALPFDPSTQALVVHGSFYDAPSAERLVTTYSLPVVYEERLGAVDATQPTLMHDGRPRFTAARRGPPELCDSITDAARLKATVTRHYKIYGSTPFCFYEANEAPELPVVRLQSSQEKLRIVGAEGVIDRTTLTSGNDKREVRSVKAAPYQYVPMPVFGCFINSGAQRWDCTYEFLKERQRATPDNVALVGQSLGLMRR